MAFSSLPFILFLSIPFSNGTSLLHQRTISGKEESLVPWRRGAVEEPIFPAEVVGNTSFILAAERSRRKNPLNGFKDYTGGWNITEKHYWASVGFTAGPLFLIAAVWFFGVASTVLLCTCVCYFCCRRRSYSYSHMVYAVSLVFVVLSAVTAIIGCIILYTGQVKFQISMSDTLDFVDGQANIAVENLRKFSDNLYSARKVGVDQLFLPASIQNQIVALATKVNSTASFFDIRVSENSKRIQNLLNKLKLVALVMFSFAILGLLFSIFGQQFLVYHLVLIGWILVAGTFVLCGLFVVLHNVVADTCISMNEWALHPSTHTAIDDILPCVNVSIAKESLYRSREVTYQLVNVVNTVITNISNKNFPPGIRHFYYNQSGPMIPELCNPYNPNLTDHTCVTGEVDFKNATQVWRGYVCNTSVISGFEICTTVGRMTQNIYKQMAAAVSMSFSLHHYVPFFTQLEDCTFVRQTFSTIGGNNCPGLRKYSRWAYLGLAMVSTGLMFSSIFWIFLVRQQRYSRISRRRNGRGRRVMREFSVLGASFG